MKHEIVISNPGNDEMGASFRSLLEALEQIGEVQPEDELFIDLHRLSFVHPFLILPVCSFISKFKQNNVTLGIRYGAATRSYLETVLFPEGFNAMNTSDWNRQLFNFQNKTYLPICQIPVARGTTEIREQLLTTFENILLHQLKLTGQMVSVVKYLISEAMDNIVDHANVSNGWIMVQNYPTKGFLDICILDTGLGLLGSYKAFDVTGINTDIAALEQAINGNSTKQITETRGYGIDTSRRMLVDGLKGKYFLFSGSAFYIYTNELEQITPLSRNIKWTGTMLALRVPNSAPVGFNYTAYLE
jgi:anti-sigma regulatory factor (Ser/Thr protein kinase)